MRAPLIAAVLFAVLTQLSILSLPLTTAAEPPVVAKCEDETCPTAGSSDASSAAEFDQVREKLARSISVRYDGIPFHAALGQFAKDTKLDIVFDRIEAKHHNITINLVLDRAPAKVVLREILNQTDDELAYAIRDGFVHVAARERLDKIQEARVYRFGILPSVTAGMPVTSEGYGEDLRTNKFRDLLTVVEPASWESSGGQGRLASVNGNLVVWQTPRVHEQIADLLDDLQRADKQDTAEFEKTAATAAVPPVVPVQPALPLPAAPSQLNPARE